MTPIKFQQAKSYSRANRTAIDGVCVHTMEAPEGPATAENVASWFAGANAPKASAHYNVDADSIVQSVLEKDVAWHAGPANGWSIGIEHAGYAKQTAIEWEDLYSTAMLELSAELVGGICRRYDIPVRKLSAEDLRAGERRGIFGHVDVTNGLTGGKGHWDPGPNFPWRRYLERVAHHAGRPFELEEPKLPAVVKPQAVEAIDPKQLVEVKLGTEAWLVSPVYVAPVGIGQAKDLAARLGCELPTKELVDAIWKAADLRIDGSKMIRQHDGTPKTMDSWDMHATQARRLADLVGDRSLGRDFHLLAGAFKDVVVEKGKVGLYGWHRATGAVIQPFYGGHSLSWRDYSQGLRLCRRK